MMIGLGAAAIIVVGGGAAYLLTQDNEDSNSTDTSQSSTGDASQANSFNPNWSETQPFVATITTDGEVTGTIASDGEGAISFTATVNGQESRFIYTDDAYYACTGDECTKLPLSQSSTSSFDPAQYQFDEDRISSLKGLTSYKGQEPCGSTTCDVWEYSTEGTTSTLYLDTNTKSIVRVRHVSANGQESDITYEYKDVSIAVPANAQEINIPNVPQ
jgi:hypothetical protein